MALTNGTSHGDKGLKILIAGAGIGGLTAAIALRRQGHHVHVSTVLLQYLGRLGKAKTILDIRAEQIQQRDWCCHTLGSKCQWRA